MALSEKLTAHQQEIGNQVIDAIVNNGEARVILRGCAGVGKTFLVNELIKELKAEWSGLAYKNVQLTAPTHQAVMQLKEKTEEEEWITFQTIHSALKLKRSINHRTGQVTFISKCDPRYTKKEFLPFYGSGLVVIDEASMLEKKLLDFIAEYPNLTFLFIGDPKQLNPPGEADSAVFMQGWPEFELTEIIRQGAGNPIIDLSRNLLEIWKKKDILVPVDEGFLGYTHTKDYGRIIEKLAQVNGTKDLKYLAYMNDEVNATNRFVRQRLYGDKPKKVEQGEYIILKGPYGEYFNNQVIKVETVELIARQFIVPNKNSKIQDKGGLHLMNMHDYDGKGNPRKDDQGNLIFNCDFIDVFIYLVNGNIPVIHEEYEALWKSALEHVTKLCNAGLSWRAKFFFEEQIADISYNHALTVHKSQGSTFKRTILNVNNLSRNRTDYEKERLFYTGVTRASDILVLFNA